MCGGDAAFCQVTLTTCFLAVAGVSGQDATVRTVHTLFFPATYSARTSFCRTLISFHGRSQDFWTGWGATMSSLPSPPLPFLLSFPIAFIDVYYC